MTGARIAYYDAATHDELTPAQRDELLADLLVFLATAARQQGKVLTIERLSLDAFKAQGLVIRQYGTRYELESK